MSSRSRVRLGCSSCCITADKRRTKTLILNACRAVLSLIPMKRRQFMQTLAAAATAPLVPGGLFRGARVSPAVYAKAVSFSSGGAYFTSNFLQTKLGLSDAARKIVVSRLKADGLVGDMGQSGLMFSRTFHAKHIKAALTTAKAAAETVAPAQADAPDKVSQVDVKSDVLDTLDPDDEATTDDIALASGEDVVPEADDEIQADAASETGDIADDDTSHA